MAYSHRPTWNPKKLRPEEGGSLQIVSGRDQHGYTKLKQRVLPKTQQVVENLIVNYKEDEDDGLDNLKKFEEKKTATTTTTTKVIDEEDKDLEEFDDRDDEVFSDDDDNDNNNKVEEEEDDESSDDDDDDDSSDEEEIAKELEKIRQERELKAQQEAEEKEILEEKLKLQQTQSGDTGSSTTAFESGGGGAKLKRRWDADVVFRNQTKNEPQVKKRFINDTIRNDFHKNFLKKYIR